MFDLNTIKTMNDRACAVKVEDNHNRNCSWVGSVADGIILHSAKLRNTVFLSPPKAGKFLGKIRLIGRIGYQDKLNALIESYFV